MSTAENLSENLSLADFQPLAEFVEENPHIFPTMGSARWAIHHGERNGLNDYGVIAKVNNKMFVVKPRALQWMLSGQK